MITIDKEILEAVGEERIRQVEEALKVLDKAADDLGLALVRVESLAEEGVAEALKAMPHLTAAKIRARLCADACLGWPGLDSDMERAGHHLARLARQDAQAAG